jgi:hypothetical protein
MTTADLLLHPVRLRIVQAFLGDRALTTGDLRAELPDVPPASLYRHVALSPDEIESMSREDHRHAFMAFVAGLLADFDRYLSREHIDAFRDGVGYRLAGLWLSDQELTEMSRELVRVIQPRAANAPRPGRRRRILATVLLLGDDAPAAEDPSSATGSERPASG